MRESCIGRENRRVPGTPVAVHDKHGASAHPLDRAHDIEIRGTISGAQIEGRRGPAIDEVGERNRMCRGQIGHVDVIANGGSVL